MLRLGELAARSPISRTAGGALHPRSSSCSVSDAHPSCLPHPPLRPEFLNLLDKLGISKKISKPWTRIHVRSPGRPHEVFQIEPCGHSGLGGKAQAGNHWIAIAR